MLDFKQNIKAGDKKYKESVVFGLTLNCPVTNKPITHNCYLFKLKQLFLKERFELLKNMTEKELDNLIDKHFECDLNV